VFATASAIRSIVSTQKVTDLGCLTMAHARLRRASHELVHALSISLGPFENALALLTTRVWIVIWIGAQDLQVG
jgi:hypothetical protein